ncbi:hypothetical protein CDL12_18726 [Handroanthus impetiginosus]|uniref:Uncharacterized protein n=1 Tax=Handroanthus impetiginosus TaxID=429701 RepID=A0A2G9GTZ8_9LAMI|nr:hypothetical protein CDL12_18726 [Handroanthus impetiginosus]
MDSNDGSGKDKGSVFPGKKKHVSTMVGKKMVEVGEKAVKSAVNAVKKHNEKSKIKFSQAKMDSNNGKSSGYQGTQSSKNKATVIPKEKEHVSTMVGKKIAEAFMKNKDKAKVSPANNN